MSDYPLWVKLVAAIPLVCVGIPILFRGWKGYRRVIRGYKD